MQNGLFTLAALVLAWSSGCGGGESVQGHPVDAGGRDGGVDTAREDARGQDAGDDVAVETDTGADAEIVVDPNAPGLRRAPTQEGVDPDGLDLTEGLVVGQVRAGRVLTGNGGFGGPEANCKPNDFVLANAAAHFCIEGKASNNRIFFDGGRLTDAEPLGVDPLEGQSGRDRLDLVSTFINLGAQSAANVEVVRDGSEGLAVVRVTGRVDPSMYLAGIVGPALFSVPDIDVETEFRLAPDSQRLEIVTFFINRSGHRRSINPGDILFWGDTLTYFFLGHGTVLPEGSQGTFGAGQGVAYGWFNEESTGTVEIPIGSALPAVPLTLPGMSVEDGQTGVVRRHFVVATDVAGVLEVAATELPDNPTAGGGLFVTAPVVVTRGDQPMAGALVRFTPVGAEEQPADDNWYVDYTDSQGHTRLRAEPGRYQVVVEDVDGPLATEIVTLVEGQEIALSVPEGGVVHLNVTERRGDAQIPMPAKVWLFGDARERLVFVLRGTEDVELRAGNWRWEASRGTEFSAATGEFTLAAGGSVDLPITLEHVLATPGLIAGDFHQHAGPSLDSVVAVRDRVLSNIAEGVDFAVSSDHDTVTDFQPVIEELGATDLIASMPGSEVSPLYGHFGLYPLRMIPDAVARGGLPLAYKDADGQVLRYEGGAALQAAMRAIPGTRMIQLNHPRGSTAYFNSAHWAFNTPVDTADPGTGWDFDTMEIINGDNCAQTLDWFSLHNQGFRVVGVGNSDTHTLPNESGYPRNYFPADVSSPSEITSDVIIDGMLSGDVVVSAGALIEFTDPPGQAGSVRPGQTVSGSSVEVGVRVLTAPWTEVDHLVVFRNGALVETYEIGAGPGAIVDFEGPITLDAGTDDAWFVLMAYTRQRATVAFRGEKIFAIANPIFVDADGSGSFDPPGLIPIEPASVPLLCD